MAKRLIVLVIIGIVLLGGAYAYRVQSHKAQAVSMRDSAVLAVRGMDLFAQKGDYLIGLIDSAHDGAFRASYDGALLGIARISEEEYMGELFEQMIQRARADGQTDVAEDLVKVRIARGIKGYERR